VDHRPRRATPDVETIEAALRALRDLPPGWDGGHAPPPRAAAIDRLLPAVRLAEAAGALPDRAVADVEGGAALYFFGGPRSADGGWQLQAGLLANNDGELVLYLRDRSQPAGAFEELPEGTGPLPAAVRQIARFLNGA